MKSMTAIIFIVVFFLSVSIWWFFSGRYTVRVWFAHNKVATTGPLTVQGNNPPASLEKSPFFEQVAKANNISYEDIEFIDTSMREHGGNLDGGFRGVEAGLKAMSQDSKLTITKKDEVFHVSMRGETWILSLSIDAKTGKIISSVVADVDPGINNISNMSYVVTSGGVSHSNDPFYTEVAQKNGVSVLDVQFIDKSLRQNGGSLGAAFVGLEKGLEIASQGNGVKIENLPDSYHVLMGGSAWDLSLTIDKKTGKITSGVQGDVAREPKI